jgi:hypothetical protein
MTDSTTRSPCGLCPDSADHGDHFHAGPRIDLTTTIRLSPCAETRPQAVAQAPGSDGLVPNRRAPKPGTAVSATTGFGTERNPATCPRERSR